MISAGINLKNKKVLIIGGGNVALRKAKFFSKEGALLTIIAPSLIDELKAYAYKQREYAETDLKDQFLVYAATSSTDINHEIVRKCYACNILCGSSTKDELSTYHSLPYYEDDLGVLSLNMLESLPTVKPLLKELMDSIDHQKITLISAIRKELVQKNKTYSFELLYKTPVDILQFILDSLKEGRGHVYLYHGGGSLAFPCLNPSIVLDRKEIIEYKRVLNYIECHYYGILINDGHIYRMIAEQVPLVNQPLITSKKDIQYLKDYFRDETKETVIIVHPTKVFDYKQYDESNIYFKYLTDTLTLEHKSYQFILLLSSKGSHYLDSINKINELIKKGYSIEYHMIFEYKEICEYLITKT